MVCIFQIIAGRYREIRAEVNLGPRIHTYFKKVPYQRILRRRHSSKPKIRAPRVFLTRCHNRAQKIFVNKFHMVSLRQNSFKNVSNQ
jgi:hypothetical protein